MALFTYNRLMKYDGQFLFPPRPEAAVIPNMLGFYDKRGWWGQIKCNGTGGILGSNSTDIIAMNRHGENHRAWQPTTATTELLVKVANGKWIVVVAELMHNKVSGIRNINYINDLLVYNGEFLYGTTFEHRQELLMQIFKDHITGEQEYFYELGPHFWLAKRVVNCKKTFAGLTKPEHEGIVMKDPKAKLNLCSKIGSNVSWMIKCRKPTKNYGF